MFRSIVVTLCVFLNVVVLASQPIALNLSEFQWTLTNERGYNNVTIPGTVPGDTFTDLMNRSGK